MSRSPKLFVAVAILAVGVVGVVVIFALKDHAEAKPPPPRIPVVSVVTVEPKPLDFVVRAHGTVRPRREGDLVPQVSGNVEWISPALTSGGFFDEGEVLLKIDRADYEVALESARASIARSESEYSRASREFDRQKKLADRSVASQTNLDVAQNAARIAEASLREARARLEQARRDLSRTEIVAPYAGRVRSAEVDVGQFVSRGTPVAKIYAVDFAEVRLPISDSELGYVDLPLLQRGDAEESGPVTRLRAHFAGAERVWQGRIVRTEGEIDPQSRMVNVVAEVADPYGRKLDDDEREGRVPLAVGLFVEADIVGLHVDAAIELPRAALREGDVVLVVGEDDAVHMRPVEVLRIDSDEVVIGEGLEAGERVIVTPLRAVVEGMTVRPVVEPEERARSTTPSSSGAAS